MPVFISLIFEVLQIQLTIGSVSIPLGGLLLALIILYQGVWMSDYVQFRLWHYRNR